jgi:zinc D-Ala-D-Ala carboxypeptidase
MIHLPRRSMLLIVLTLAACQQRAAVVLPVPSRSTTGTATLTLPSESSETPAPVPSETGTFYLLPTMDGTLVPCGKRSPGADLFVIVNSTFGLGSAYVPPDLVELGGYVSGYVTLPDLLLRREAAEALGRMVTAMKAGGLAPTILSAYRSYADQSVTHQRWLMEDPQNAGRVSAEPGHSEHQLGTALDFGSPGLSDLTGNPAIKFSPLFARTGEGLWLTEHAHEYGFTLTNPPDAGPWTGLTFEPWHYRYVGIELATYLYQRGDFLIRYLFQVRPGLPCTLE